MAMNHEKASDKDRDMSTISALLQPFQTFHDTHLRKLLIFMD